MPVDYFLAVAKRVLPPSFPHSLPAILPPAVQLFKLLHKYRPETKAQKKERLRSIAQKKSEGEDATPSKKKPVVLKYGLNHVTKLIEMKTAKLVVIAHDVDPIEVCVCVCALLFTNGRV